MIDIRAVNLSDTIRWAKSLGDRLKNAAHRGLNDPDALSSREILARQIVDTVVYAVYEPEHYKRTFELLNSVRAVAISSDPPETGIAIDLTHGNAAILPPGDISYARFMLPEYAPTSFWNLTNIGKGPPRDFMAVWQQVFGEMIPRDMMAAIDRDLLK